VKTTIFNGLKWREHDIDGKKNQNIIDNAPFLSAMQVLFFLTRLKKKLLATHISAKFTIALLKKRLNIKPLSM
jgi:hypothetical protein